MKRVIALLAALAVSAGPLAMGGAAFAKDHGGERRAEQRGGGEQRGDGRGRADGPQGGWRGDDRGGPARRDYAPQPDPRGYAPPQAYAQPRYAPQYAPQPAPQYESRARRGGYLAPEAAGAMPDYGRYRLRQPPRGYAWVRTPNGYAMVRMDTGQVFDVVPF